jgi:hypothetical protein
MTGDNIFASGYNPATGNWVNHDTLAAVVTNSAGSLSVLPTAVRLVGTGYAQLAVVQADANARGAY